MIILPHTHVWIVPPNSAQTDVPYRGQSFQGVNHLIMRIRRYFLSGCIELYLYLYHACSNYHYCRFVVILFLTVSASLLSIFE